MDRAPSKLRLLQLGWESTDARLRQVAQTRFLTSSSPSMDRAPSKLRLLQLGWESTDVRLRQVARTRFLTSSSPSMDRAPSKLRLLQLGWESTDVRLRLNAPHSATGRHAAPQSTATRSRSRPRPRRYLPEGGSKVAHDEILGKLEGSKPRPVGPGDFPIPASVEPSDGTGGHIGVP